MNFILSLKDVQTFGILPKNVFNRYLFSWIQGQNQQQKCHEVWLNCRCFHCHDILWNAANLRHVKSDSNLCPRCGEFEMRTVEFIE